jgi:hypothetical protein
MAACNGPPDDACIFCRMTDELLIKKHTVSDGQATFFRGRAVFELVDVCRLGQPCFKGQIEIPCCFGPVYWL